MLLFFLMYHAKSCLLTDLSVPYSPLPVTAEFLAQLIFLHQN